VTAGGGSSRAESPTSRRSVLRGGLTLGVGVSTLALPAAAAASSPGTAGVGGVFRREDAVTLSTATPGVGTAAITSLAGPGGVGPDGTHGYFAGVQDGVASLVKFRLSDLAVVGVLPLVANDAQSVRTSVGGVAISGSHAYIAAATATSQHSVEKVRLDAAAGTDVVAGMRWVGATAVIHQFGAGYTMVVADDDHVVTSDLFRPEPAVYKTLMHKGTDLPPENLGEVFTQPGDFKGAPVAGLASDGTHLYAADEVDPDVESARRPLMTKIALSGSTEEGSGGMQVVGHLSLGADDGLPYGVVHSGGHVYLASWTSAVDASASVVKVATSGGTAPGSGGLERLGAVTLDAGEDEAATIVLAGPNLYVGTYTAPGRVVKLTANLGTATLPVRSDAVTLDAGEGPLWTGFASGQSLYFGTSDLGNAAHIIRCVDPAL
jgi:hypothetical protein